MRIERCEPILPSRNLDETRAFYGKVGFTAWFQGRAWPDYEIMSRGHLVIHFFAEREPPAGGHDAGCYWRVRDADRLYEECAALNLACEGIPRLTAPVDQPWGMREFTLVDPSGNLVRVGHDLHDPRRFIRWPRWIGRLAGVAGHGGHEDELATKRTKTDITTETTTFRTFEALCELCGWNRLCETLWLKSSL